MKKTILILMLAVALTGCLDEGDSGCPADMSLTFLHEDELDPLADYDTQIGNDVLLYVFKNKKYVCSMEIPYSRIARGKACPIRKTKDIDGQLDFTAWAVKSKDGDPNSVPKWQIGDDLDSRYLVLPAMTRGTVNCRPTTRYLYLGTLSVTERKDESSSHTIYMINPTCRVKVNVLDNINLFNSYPMETSDVRVSGVMSSMDMKFDGCGEEAVVYADLVAVSGSDNLYTTDWFGVLPSGNDQNSIEVQVVHGDDIVAISIPGVKARAGGEIVVDLNLGVSVNVTVDGYRIQGVEVNYI